MAEMDTSFGESVRCVVTKSALWREYRIVFNR